MLIKKILLIIILLLNFSFAKVGDWHNFARSFPINDAIAINGNLWLATNGGLRKLPQDLSLGSNFTPVNNMSSSHISSLIYDDSNTVYAIDNHGVINQFNTQNNQNQIISYAFKSLNLKSVKGASQFYKGFLVLAFESRLSFFDISEKRSLLSLSKIGDNNLESTKITDIEIVNDTVYVATGKRVYFRKIDFSNINQDYTLPNPQSWELLQEETFDVNNIYSKGGQIVSDSLEGIYLENDGVVNKALIGINSNIIIDGTEIDDPKIYEEVSLVDGMYRYNPNFYISNSDKFTWIVSDKMIWNYDGKDFKSISPIHLWPGNQAHNLVLNSNNDLLVWSVNNIVVLNASGFGLEDITTVTGGMDPLRALNDVYKGLAIDNKDNLVTSTWGGGVLWRKEGALDIASVDYRQFAYGNSCMEDFDKGNYTISVGAATADFVDGTFVNTFPDNLSSNNYGLAFINNKGEINCKNNIGTGRYPRNILVSKTNDDIYLYASSSDEIDDAMLSWVDVFKLTDIDGSGDFDYQLVSSIATGKFGTVHDMAQDSLGRVWVMSRENLGYLEQDYFTQSGIDSVISLDNKYVPKSSSYNAIELAAYDKLWLATSGDGVFRFEMKEDLKDVTVSSYSAKQGLLSDVVYDIATNDQTGMIWFGHDIGVSSYESRDRLTDGFQEEGSKKVIAYPNPFRPGVHPYLTIDNVSTDAKIHILSSSGSQVATFQGDDLEGGMLQWDGRNKNNNFLRAGIYYYTVTGAEKKAKGKIIILR